MKKNEKIGLVNILIGMWLILLFTQAETAFFFRAHLGVHPQIMVPLMITVSGVIMLYGYIQMMELTSKD